MRRNIPLLNDMLTALTIGGYDGIQNGDQRLVQIYIGPKM